MNTELTGIVIIFLLTVLLAYPLGKYMARVFAGEKTFTDFLNPLERLIYRFAGINPEQGMNWKEYLKAMLSINMLWLFYAFFLLLNQASLPLNPDGNPNMTPDLSFNTAISFLVNCNLQHYSGESGLTYFTQLFVITFLQFVSAATGIACAVALFNALRHKTTDNLGNFWSIFTKTITRILLPLCIVIAILLAFNGSPASFDGKDTIVSLQGDTVQVSRGPAAGMIAIKHLGTNGGGWFGVNSAHPLENPNYFTSYAGIDCTGFDPDCHVVCTGFLYQTKKTGLCNIWSNDRGYALSCCAYNILGNSWQSGDCQNGNFPGHWCHGRKRSQVWCQQLSGYWSIVTTIISTGSVNSMHDSSMPLSGMMQLLGMLINAFYGGCGVGILNYFIYIIIAVFIGGLMVGRTPEFLGHKVEAREVKIAALVTLLSAFLIKGGTALAAYYFVQHGNIDWAVKPTAWLNNPGNHGFSEMFYEFTSANANNGSGFEGLGDNNIFWNVTTGYCIVTGKISSYHRTRCHSRITGEEKIHT